MPNQDTSIVISKLKNRVGKKNLLEALKNQAIVAGDLILAKKLIKHTKVVFYQPNDILMEQGGADNDIYFILGGEVLIEVNGRKIATRKAREHVGEMAMLDITTTRSATVRALEITVVAKISEEDFTRIANQVPDLWRRLAIVLAKRLVERNKFHKASRSKPVIFIGSSSESLKIAEIINAQLSKKPFVPRLWKDNIFECSKTTIEDLMRITKEVDFAIIVFSSDDMTKSRGVRKYAPRDNVVFELGLFMGALSRERTYFIVPEGRDIKIPTDLLGVKCLLYKENKRIKLEVILKPLIKELTASIKRIGQI